MVPILEDRKAVADAIMSSFEAMCMKWDQVTPVLLLL